MHGINAAKKPAVVVVVVVVVVVGSAIWLTLKGTALVCAGVGV